MIELKLLSKALYYCFRGKLTVEVNDSDLLMDKTL